MLRCIKYKCSRDNQLSTPRRTCKALQGQVATKKLTTASTTWVYAAGDLAAHREKRKNCWQHVELTSWVSLSSPRHYLQLSHVIRCWKNKIEHEPCSPGSLLAMRPCLLSKVVTLSVLPSHRFFEVNLNPCHQLVVRGAKHLRLSACPRANCQGWYKLLPLLACLHISRISFESWTCRASQRNEKNVLRTLNCRSGSWQGAARRVSFCSCICASFQAWKCKIRRQRLQLHWPFFMF